MQDEKTSAGADLSCIECYRSAGASEDPAEIQTSTYTSCQFQSSKFTFVHKSFEAWEEAAVTSKRYKANMENIQSNQTCDVASGAIEINMLAYNNG